jgi:hypothetical protein
LRQKTQEHKREGLRRAAKNRNDWALSIDSKGQACYFLNGAKNFVRRKSTWTVIRKNGVRSEEDFPDKMRGETSREAIELRISATKRRDRGVQHRAREFDFSSELQIDFAKRGIEADQAWAGGVHGHQREFDEGAAPADRV